MELIEKLNNEQDMLIMAKEALETANRDLVNRLEDAEMTAKVNDEKVGLKVLISFLDMSGSSSSLQHHDNINIHVGYTYYSCMFNIK